MWARTVEVMLAIWLAISPFVFGHGDDHVLWWIDLGAAGAVLVLALLSFAPRLRRVHLLELPVAAALVLHGYLAGAHPSPAAQNHLVLGLLLGMFALVPSQASRPPRSWSGPS